jgi:hypothetical protein
MQQPGILQPAEADTPSIGRRRFTEQGAAAAAAAAVQQQQQWQPVASSQAR